MENNICLKCPFVKEKDESKREHFVDKLNLYKYMVLYKAKKEVKHRIYLFTEKEEYSILPEIFDNIISKDEKLFNNTNLILFPHTLCLKGYNANSMQYCYHNQEIYKKLYNKLNGNLIIAFGKNSIKALENLITIFIQNNLLDNRINIDLSSFTKGTKYRITLKDKDVYFDIIIENKVTSLKYNIENYTKLRNSILKNDIIVENKDISSDNRFSISLISEKDLILRERYEFIIPDNIEEYNEKLKDNIFNFLINNPNIPYVIDVETLKPNGEMTLNWFEEDTQIWFISIAFKRDKQIIKSYSFSIDCPHILMSDTIKIEIRKDLKRLLTERKTGIIINHNIKFDLLNLFKYLDIDANEILIKNNEIPINIKEINIFDIAKTNLVLLDTIILEKMLDENKISYSLQNLTTEILGYPFWKDSLKEYSQMCLEKNKHTEKELNKKAIEILKYSALDSLSAYDLFEYEYDKYIKTSKQKKNHYLYQLAFKYIPFIYKTEISLEFYGMAINKNKLTQLQEKFTIEHAELKDKIKILLEDISGQELNDLNLSSRQQLTKILHSIKIPMKKTKKGNYKLDTNELKKFSNYNFQDKKINKTFEYLMQYYKTEKLLTSFYNEEHYKFDKNNLIHPIIHINGATKTGRNTSEKPNIQQLPREGFVKSMFISRDPQNRCIIQSDHSQAELRITALISQDPNLIEVFEKGRDPYKEMCAKVWNKKLTQVTKDERQTMKSIVLGTSYGLTTKGLALGLEISTKKAEAVLLEFNKTFSKLETYQSYIRNMVFIYSYAIGMTFRKRRFPFIKLKQLNIPNKETFKSIFNGLYNKVKNQAINSPVQGSTSDMLSLNFAVLYNKIINENLDVCWINTVHDSAVFDVNNKDKNRVIELMNETLLDLHPLMLKWLKMVYDKQYKLCPFKIDISVGQNLGSYDEENNPDGLKEI